MDRYLYSLVRCVPDPRTGEFVNVAAIAGSPDTGEWSVRQVNNESHARRLAGTRELTSLHDLLGRVGIEIDQRKAALDHGDTDPLGEAWLWRLHHDHRNIVQLSAPTPMVATDAEDALDVVFEQMVIDPVLQSRGSVTKHRVLSRLRDAYKQADLDPQLVQPRATIFVGDSVHTSVDFAIANGSTVQLTQGWSFQLTGVEDVALQVKAWAYALRGLRAGDGARVVTTAHEASTIAKDVDLEVVVAEPQSDPQTAVYEEAQQVFRELGAAVHQLGDVTAVAERAADLVRGHPA